MTSAPVARAATAPELLAALVASDPGTPRLTWYDDAAGPTRGERIELSARVLANWVAKAANLLVDELDVEPGDAVLLDLPVHWRSVYWALGTWAAEAVVHVDPSAGPALVVTDAPGRAGAGRAVAVALPALARRWAGDALPAGALDGAAELGSQPDAFTPAEEPAAEADALAVAGVTTGAADLLGQARALAAGLGWAQGERVCVAVPGDAPLHEVLTAVLAAWSVDGSVVLVRDPDPQQLAARLEAERVTSAYDPAGRPASRS